MNKPVYHQCPFLAEDRLSPSWLGGLLRVDSEARSNYLSVRSVPFSAPHDAIFSIYIWRKQTLELDESAAEHARSGHVVRRYAFIGSN